MKHRSTVIHGASAVILLAMLVLMLRMSVGDVPVTRASAQGVVLSVVELAPADRIVVDYAGGGCRTYRNWNFVLFGGPDRRLTVMDAGGSYETGGGPSDRPSPIGTISLSARDCQGIEDLLQIYHHPDGSSGSTTTIRIHVSYYHGGERIGSEEFVDQGMIDNWIWQRNQQGLVPADSGVTPEMISFPDLVQRVERTNRSS
jgi:hypothetical protein